VRTALFTRKISSNTVLEHLNKDNRHWIDINRIQINRLFALWDKNTVNATAKNATIRT
jgi:hypothetical protein